MNTMTNLADVIKLVNAYKGSWTDSQRLAWDVDRFLWATYDPHDAFIYTNIKHWADLLKKTMTDGSYDQLDREQALSILFGLHHRNRIIDGLWVSMFDDGVTQKLLERLLALESA